MSSTQTIELTTGDGERLSADLSEPTGTVTGSVVICHPHPRYGGNRRNAVVDAVFRAMPEAGFRALRFDFRPAHGHSFGAVAALRTSDQRVAAIVAIAPPLAVMPIDKPPSAPVYALASADHFLADHFLAGHTAHITARTIDWLTARSPHER